MASSFFLSLPSPPLFFERSFPRLMPGGIVPPCHCPYAPLLFNRSKFQPCLAAALRFPLSRWCGRPLCWPFFCCSKLQVRPSCFRNEKWLRTRRPVDRACIDFAENSNPEYSFFLFFHYPWEYPVPVEVIRVVSCPVGLFSVQLPFSP